MAEEISEMKVSEIGLKHLYLEIEVGGSGGQLLGYDSEHVILGPQATPRYVKVDKNESMKVYGAPEERREFNHFGR